MSNNGLRPLRGEANAARRVGTYLDRVELYDFGVGTPFSQGKYDFLVIGDPADPNGDRAEIGRTGGTAEHGYNLRVQGFIQVENSMSVFSRYQPYVVVGRMGIDNRFPNVRPQGYGEDLALGVVGTTGDYFSNTLAGDGVLRVYGTGEGTSGRQRRLHFGSNAGSVATGYADSSLIVDNTTIELRRVPNWAGSSMTATAAALPSSPSGYTVVQVGGFPAKVPFYYTPIAADTFNRSNGALGSTPTGSKTWTTASANGSSPVVTAQIFSNQLQVLCTGSGQGFALVDCGTANHDASITFAALEQSQALTVRFVDSSNWVQVGKDAGASYSMTRRVSGSYTTMGTTSSVTPTAGDVIRLTAIGTTYTLYVNGTQALQVTDASANTTGTKVGAMTNGNTGVPRFDDFSVTAV